MITIYKYLKFIVQTKAIADINMIIRGWRNLPLLKILTGKSDVYAFPRLKKFALFFTWPYFMIKKFFASLLLWAIIFNIFMHGLIWLQLKGIWPALQTSVDRGGIYHLTWLVVGICFLFMATTTDPARENCQEIFSYAKYYHLPSVALGKINLFIYPLLKSVFSCLAMLTLSLFWPALTALEIFTINLVHLAISILSIYLRLKFKWNRNLPWSLALVKLTVIAAVLWCAIKFTPPVFSWLCYLAPLFAILYLYLAHHFLRWNGYAAFVELAVQNNQEVENFIATSSDTGLKLTDTDRKNTCSSNFNAGTDSIRDVKSQKRGYALLNSLFFQRHFRLLFRPWIIKNALLAVVATLVLTAGYLDTRKVAAIGIGSGFTADLPKLLVLLPNIYIFISYVISNNKNITKAMFVNCDAALLNYGFYRQKNAVFTMLCQRLRRFFFMNCVTATILSIFTLAIYSFRLPYNFKMVGSIVLFTYILGLFFAVYQVAIYYVIQPYDERGEITNPIVNFTNMFLYMICVINFRSLKFTPPTLLLTIAALVVLVIVALLSLYKLAPKTFRLRY